MIMLIHGYTFSLYSQEKLEDRVSGYKIGVSS